MNVLAIIPARYHSSRFPGKPLALICGKPMFWHVAQRAAACPQVDRVVLATDDPRIEAAAHDLGVDVLRTGEHVSGTDRVLEAARLLGASASTIVLNVQGDEPLLHPSMLEELIAPFADPDIGATTLARPISAQEALRPDTVKVVRTLTGRALYFSRAPIPYGREHPATFLGHVGLYGFRFPVLEKFSVLEQSPLERTECLEQLRLLEAGIPIFVGITSHVTHGVDRPEDIPTVTRMMHENPQ
jgi:3-deoxy-manno-octulosonate cytidylyltransferase (CMP-KDO synthetase)